MALNYPKLTEKAVGLIEKNNTITFIVDRKDTKAQVKKAIEETYKVKVVKVTTLVNRKGLKVAYIKLVKENSASDLATKLNII